MFTRNILILCAFLSVLFLFSGCSSANARDQQISRKSDTVKTADKTILTKQESAILDAIDNDCFIEFLGKSFNPSEAEKMMNAAEETQNSRCNNENEIETKCNVNFRIMFGFYHDRGVLSKDKEYNLTSIIQNGLIPIIPRNPYSGEDIKTSFEYSPGDAVFACNSKAAIDIHHLGPAELFFDATLKDNNKLFYLDKTKEIENLTDGRTLYSYHKFTDDKPNLAFTNKRESNDNFEKQKKIKWLFREIENLMQEYFRFHEDAPQSIDEIINYFGRRNPASWNNPYSGKKMIQMPKFAVCEMIPGEVTEYLDRPEPFTKVNETEYINKYAGNYSYTVVETKRGPMAILSIYYIKPNGRLSVLNCQGQPLTSRNN